MESFKNFIADRARKMREEADLLDQMISLYAAECDLEEFLSADPNTPAETTPPVPPVTVVDVSRLSPQSQDAFQTAAKVRRKSNKTVTVTLSEVDSKTMKPRRKSYVRKKTPRMTGATEAARAIFRESFGDLKSGQIKARLLKRGHMLSDPSLSSTLRSLESRGEIFKVGTGLWRAADLAQ